MVEFFTNVLKEKETKRATVQESPVVTVVEIQLTLSMFGCVLNIDR